MARMVKCVKLGREEEGLNFPPLRRRARQAHLGKRCRRKPGKIVQAQQNAGSSTRIA